MEQERWHKLENLFHATVECAPEARQALLDEACQANVDLRREIELLLSTEAQVGSFLEKPILQALIAGLHGPESLLGRDFGAYRVVRRRGMNDYFFANSSSDPMKPQEFQA